MLVYTTGDGVNGFTLNPAIGTFYLSHPNMQFPESGNIYSINEGNYNHFPQGVKNYIKYCQKEEEDSTLYLEIHRIFGIGFSSEHDQGRDIHLSQEQYGIER